MSGTKLAAMAFAGFVFILIAVTGKLGSVLAAVIDPANMNESGQFGNVPSGTPPPPSQGGTLTPSQIAYYASRAGFKGQNLIISIAVALAESGGSVAAINTSNANGTVDRGLWQINSVHTQFTTSKLFDPAYNAYAAFQISGGSNWFPWATYTNGRYQKFLNDAQKAVQGVLV